MSLIFMKKKLNLFKEISVITNHWYIHNWYKSMPHPFTIYSMESISYFVPSHVQTGIKGLNTWNIEHLVLLEDFCRKLRKILIYDDFYSFFFAWTVMSRGCPEGVKLSAVYNWPLSVTDICIFLCKKVYIFDKIQSLCCNIVRMITKEQKSDKIYTEGSLIKPLSFQKYIKIIIFFF